jgi:chitinase
MSRKGELGSEVFYDEESTVKWMVYGSNQWISFDDAQSFQDKLAYQSSRCLKGLMIWSLDLDSPQFQAMNDLFGEKAMADAVGDTSLSDKDKEDLVDDLAAYTGQNCFVAVGCASGGDKDDAYSTCPSGYTSVALAHDPWQLDYHRPLAQCDKGEFHHVCCPTKHAPKNCEWIGVPERNVFGCERGCGESQFELTTDSYRDPKGNAVCQTGRISVSTSPPISPEY